MYSNYIGEMHARQEQEENLLFGSYGSASSDRSFNHIHHAPSPSRPSNAGLSMVQNQQPQFQPFVGKSHKLSDPDG